MAVFIDYQNTYMSARRTFGEPWAESTFGQIDPLQFGELLVSRRPYECELSYVRLYRGMPDASQDPKGYGACRAQVDHWKRLDKVAAVTRPLRYPRDGEGKPEEKGVDVELAVDMVTMAVEDRYDVAILMSRDTDLKPALEYVHRREGTRAEVAAWSNPKMHCGRLALDGVNVWCHWLEEADYLSVQDTRDWTQP